MWTNQTLWLKAGWWFLNLCFRKTQLQTHKCCNIWLINIAKLKQRMLLTSLLLYYSLSLNPCFSYALFHLNSRQNKVKSNKDKVILLVSRWLVISGNENMFCSGNSWNCFRLWLLSNVKRRFQDSWIFKILLSTWTWVAAQPPLFSEMNV